MTLSPEFIEGWNRLQDKTMEDMRKLTSSLIADDHRKLLEFFEEANPDLPRHSHRFTPENVWPERYGQGATSHGTTGANATEETSTDSPQRGPISAEAAATEDRLFRNLLKLRNLPCVLEPEFRDEPRESRTRKPVNKKGRA